MQGDKDAFHGKVEYRDIVKQRGRDIGKDIIIESIQNLFPSLLTKDAFRLPLLVFPAFHSLLTLKRKKIQLLS